MENQSSTTAPQKPQSDLQSTQAQVTAPPAGGETVIHTSGQATTGGQAPAVGETVIRPAQPAADLQSTQAHQATKPPPAGTQAEGAQGPKPGAKEQKLSALGEYRLIKKLGEGGMGAVYKGHQDSLDRDVAIKVLFKHLASNPSFVERFQREARIMARLDHPNILRCYGVGEDHGYHYFAMEFVEGGSMQNWLEKCGKFSVADALHVVIACSEGLQHAHELNMIHRDIKPDNILLTRKGVVKVADMGLAKAHGEDVSLTRTGTGAGTPIYMSPEQARDAKHVDHRSDIYSLGCMLYTFLAGKPPFEGETYVELFEAKEKGKFSPVRKFNDEVPERLDLIIDKMMAKKPEQRYQNCGELLKDLTGLGMVAKKLSFLEPEPAKKVTGPAGSKPGTPAGAKKPGVAPQAATGKTASTRPTGLNETVYWFVSYHGHDGKPVRRKLTTDQVRDLIRGENFDLKAQASRTLDGGYRALATYPEFESVLRGRIARARADKKTSKFQNVYEKLAKEEVQRQRWRKWKNLFISVGGFVKLLIWLGVIAVVGFVVFLLIKNGWHYVENFLSKATSTN
jgi:serine/threonine-protein kinase